MNRTTMNHLHLRLAQRVEQWRADGYPIESYPALAEIPYEKILPPRQYKPLAASQVGDTQPQPAHVSDVFTDTDTVAADALRIVRHFAEEPCR